MDAVPVTLGQEFRAFSTAVFRRIGRAVGAPSTACRELALGGTAAGTGLNTPRRVSASRRSRCSRKPTGEAFTPAADPREALQSRAAAGDYSSALRAFALELGRIANDLRLLASGPATGLDEIRLPPVQPGSSIMPGKVNPSLLECLNMLCSRSSVSIPRTSWRWAADSSTSTS